MKQFLFGLILLSSFSVCAADTVIGVVRQAQCMTQSGLGIVELQDKEGDTLISRWYKVKSSELCSSKVDHPMFLFETAKLTALAADNLTFGDNSIRTFALSKEGYITDLLDTEPSEGPSLSAGVKKFKTIGGKEAHNWYFTIKRKQQ